MDQRHHLPVLPLPVASAQVSLVISDKAEAHNPRRPQLDPPGPLALGGPITRQPWPSAASGLGGVGEARQRCNDMGRQSRAARSRLQGR